MFKKFERKFRVYFYVPVKVLHKNYSLRPILPFANTDISRHILVLDTFVFTKDNRVGGSLTFPKNHHRGTYVHFSLRNLCP
jgi:hypothetical protein